ncbi:MAG TPA: ankyrin repeat domain-containing protein [Tepidisphaeraceae bacterium]
MEQNRPKLFSPQAGSRGMDELQYAAYCGDLEAVKDLLAGGADVTASDQFGYTALHWNARMACTGGNRVGVAKALLEAGSSPNVTDKEGNTVLASAVEATAHEDLIDLLKSHAAI